jgi:integrase
VTEQLSSTSKDNFLRTCKSAATREIYQKAIHYYMNFLKVGYEDYDKLLEKDPKLIQMDICEFITDYSKKVAPASVSSYVSGLQKFYTMNDIILNWKKIRNFEPEYEKVAEDRPYNHTEIKQLIDIAGPRNKALILLMSSSGIRVGAIPSLRVKDLIPIESYAIYRINVYPRSKKSSYFSFCTPECRHAIDSYLEYRKRSGERIEDDSPVFRTDYNAYGRMIRKVEPCSTIAIMHTMDRLLRDIGLRGVGLENQKYKRQHIMRCHGFRKFFETNAFKAGMDNIYIRRHMGQKSGLEDSYLKLSEEELLEGDSKHTGYVGIIDQLTINEENRLKRKVETLTMDRTKLESRLDRLEELYQSLPSRQENTANLES